MADTSDNAIDGLFSTIARDFDNSDAGSRYTARHQIRSASILTVQDDETAAHITERLAPRIAGRTVIEIGGGFGLLSLHMAGVAVFAMLHPLSNITLIQCTLLTSVPGDQPASKVAPLRKIIIKVKAVSSTSQGSWYDGHTAPEELASFNPQPRRINCAQSHFASARRLMSPLVGTQSEPAPAIDEGRIKASLKQKYATGTFSPISC